LTETLVLSVLFFTASAFCTVGFLLILAKAVLERGLFGPIAFGLATYFLWVAINTVQWARQLTAHIYHDPICAHCGYDLRGTLSVGKLMCPECGRRNDPKGNDL